MLHYTFNCFYLSVEDLVSCGLFSMHLSAGQPHRIMFLHYDNIFRRQGFSQKLHRFVKVLGGCAMFTTTCCNCFAFNCQRAYVKSSYLWRGETNEWARFLFVDCFVIENKSRNEVLLVMS